MSILDVPGAHLYYEVHGRGPVYGPALLMVPGANGTVEPFRPIAKELAPHYTVVLYDRRGFSRSQLDGPQDFDHRLETDADDVHRLLRHLADGQATVFGASSGAIVALEALVRHAPAVRTVVPYEPPAMTLLPDGDTWLRYHQDLYDLYQQLGFEPALLKFRETSFAECDRQFVARVQDLGNEQIRANAMYWFEHELRQYPPARLDLGALEENADRIVLMVGQESRGYPCHSVNVELGKRLGRDVIEMPGGHVGMASDPVDFARAFLDALSKQGHGPQD